MSFDQMMLHFGAPTICGIKPGNIFSVKNEFCSEAAFLEWKNALAKNNISACRAPLKKNSSLVFLYNSDWLKKILDDFFVKEYFFKKGYKKNLTCAALVKELGFRISAQENFPHEIGILLGYPISDVIAFERDKGKGSKFCGLWQAYSDEKNAKEFFFKCKACCNLCEKWFERGYSLSRIIKKYKKAQKAA